MPIDPTTQLNSPVATPQQQGVNPGTQTSMDAAVQSLSTGVPGQQGLPVGSGNTMQPSPGQNAVNTYDPNSMDATRSAMLGTSSTTPVAGVAGDPFALTGVGGDVAGLAGQQNYGDRFKMSLGEQAPSEVEQDTQDFVDAYNEGGMSGARKEKREDRRDDRADRQEISDAEKERFKGEFDATKDAAKDTRDTELDAADKKKDEEMAAAKKLKGKDKRKAKRAARKNKRKSKRAARKKKRKATRAGRKKKRAARKANRRSRRKDRKMSRAKRKQSWKIMKGEKKAGTISTYGDGSDGTGEIDSYGN